MDRNTKTLAIGGVGLAAAVALGITGATLATADDGTSTPSAGASAAPGAGSTLPGGGEAGGPGGGAGRGGMMDAGGPLTADAASKAVTAAKGAVDGGTVTGVRALSDGTYEVTVTTDSGRVDVLLGTDFEVTGTEDHSGMGGPGDGDGDGPGAGRSGAGSGTSSTDPSDANGSSTTTSSSTPTTSASGV